MFQKNPQRKLPIHSIKNFRDLGGYRTADGTHQVCWHRLFRSGHLHRLHGKDIEHFQALGIQTVVDFRSAAEKNKEPDHLPADSRIQRIELPMLDEGNSEMMKDLRRRFEENDIQGLNTAAVMEHTYHQFPLEFSAEYAQFIQILLASDGKPVLWHCTAGKDRAGFAAALILRLLGVPMQTILADYLLSARYSKMPLRMFVLLFLKGGMRIVKLIQVMYEVRAEWMQTAFDTIDAQWGSFENYTQAGLGLTDADLVRLKEMYLEKLS